MAEMVYPTEASWRIYASVNSDINGSGNGSVPKRRQAKPNDVFCQMDLKEQTSLKLE